MRKKILQFLVLTFLFIAALPVAHAAPVPPGASDKATVEKVQFKNRISINIVGDLYLPKNIDTSKKHPAIIVGYPFGGNKEQTAGLHAQKLAELGFTALAFDAAFYGESGGMPRNTEMPDVRVEDFSAAVDFLSNHVLIDKNRIGVLGICGAGGYAIAAAKIDPRMKAIATVSLVDMGERNRKQGFARTAKLTPEKRAALLKAMAEQRTKDFVADKPHYISNIPTKGPNEFYEYYRTARGAHPRATTDYTFVSNASLLTFYPLIDIETIAPRPLLFIMGDKASSVYFSEEAYAKAAAPKELYIIKDAIHTDLYDNPTFMKNSIQKLKDFFEKNL